MDFNYEEDLRIDPDALDVEWLEQPGLYMKYCRASAQAQKEWKEAEQRVKVIRSQLIKEAETVLPKATAPKMEAFYRDHPKHQQAKQEAIEAEYRANLLQNAVFAFNQRKTALEKLVALASMNYFAQPTEPRNLSEEYRGRMDTAKETAHEKTQDRIKNGMQRRRSTRAPVE